MAMVREAAASLQLSGKDRNPGSRRNHVSNLGLMPTRQVDHGQSLCWNVLMARPECLLIPGTELLGGEQTLLTS